MNSFNKQRTLAMMTGFERYTRKTRRAMVSGGDGTGGAVGEAVRVDRATLSQAGRRPKELEQMLRIYFPQQWFNLADPAVEEALYDSATLRQFVGIDLGARAGAG